MSWSTLSWTIPATAIFTILASYALWESHTPYKRRQRLRQSLPSNIYTWRIPGNSYEAEEQIWINLDKVFCDAGFKLWPNAFCSLLRISDYPSSSGFGYAIPTRGEKGVGSLVNLRRFSYRNPRLRAARTRDGLDVIIRVVVIGKEGHDHLKILRTIATGETSLLSTNHTLPMFMEFQFEDIVFGIFPKVGGQMSNAFGSWPNNSVGDILDMLMQMLEALEFIHDLNIAHRDAFHDNFVVQWHPESLRTMKFSISRPRVYLIDFETAVQFPVGCSSIERVSVGYPVTENYARPCAPELGPGEEYNPFKLDVWQLGFSFSDFKSTIPSIDEVLVSMVDIDPVHRLDAKEAKDRLGTIVYSMPPESLLIKPDIPEHGVP